MAHRESVFCCLKEKNVFFSMKIASTSSQAIINRVGCRCHNLQQFFIQHCKFYIYKLRVPRFVLPPPHCVAFKFCYGLQIIKIKVHFNIIKLQFSLKYEYVENMSIFHFSFLCPDLLYIEMKITASNHNALIQFLKE